MKVVRDKRLRWAALGAVVASLAVGGVAYASTPSSQNKIVACYVTKTGAIRIVDGDTGLCKASEQRLVWDAEGPKFWANVGADGARVNGSSGSDAGRLGGSSVGDGEYVVSFSTSYDLSNCAPFVTVGGDFITFRMVDAYVHDQQHVYVFLQAPDPPPDGFGNDVPFHIMVQC